MISGIQTGLGELRGIADFGEINPPTEQSEEKRGNDAEPA
jgi:hypothetical protein